MVVEGLTSLYFDLMEERYLLLHFLSCLNREPFFCSGGFSYLGSLGFFGFSGDGNKDVIFLSAFSRISTSSSGI